MPQSLKTRARKVSRVVIAAIPWLIAMYIYYWLDSSETWTNETPHRGKISVAILATGMLLSFLVYSRFFSPEQK